MPNDVKALVSLVTIVVAVAFAYWEKAHGHADLFGIILGLAAFSVAAMWVFPEAGVKKGDLPPKKSGQ